MEDKDKQKADRRNRNHERSVSVFTAHDEIEVELIKELLRGSGIECVVQGRVVASLYPGFAGALGREIFVLEGDAEEAKRVLDSRSEESPA